MANRGTLTNSSGAELFLRTVGWTMPIGAGAIIDDSWTETQFDRAMDEIVAGIVDGNLTLTDSQGNTVPGTDAAYRSWLHREWAYEGQPLTPQSVIVANATANSGNFTTGIQNVPLNNTVYNRGITTDFTLVGDAIQCNFDGIVDVAGEITVQSVGGAGQTGIQMGVSVNAVAQAITQRFSFINAVNTGEAASTHLENFTVSNLDLIRLIGQRNVGTRTWIFPLGSRLQVSRIQ